MSILLPSWLERLVNDYRCQTLIEDKLQNNTAGLLSAKFTQWEDWELQPSDNNLTYWSWLFFPFDGKILPQTMQETVFLTKVKEFNPVLELQWFSSPLVTK